MNINTLIVLADLSTAFQESTRYLFAASAGLLVGGGAWLSTRRSLRKADSGTRRKAGRSAFLSSGLLAAIAAFLLGGTGLGIGGEGFGGVKDNVLEFGENIVDKTTTSFVDPTPTTNNENKDTPEQENVPPAKIKVFLSIQQDSASGNIQYFLDGNPIKPGQFEEEFRAFFEKNPALQEVILQYPEDAAAADVLAIQRVISSYPKISYTVGPAE